MFTLDRHLFGNYKAHISILRTYSKRRPNMKRALIHRKALIQGNRAPKPNEIWILVSIKKMPNNTVRSESSTTLILNNQNN